MIMHCIVKIFLILSLLALTACARHKEIDSKLNGKFRIGAVQVIIPQSPRGEEIASIVDQSFRDVIKAYGPADSSLPIQNMIVKMRVPSHRSKAVQLEFSQIRGKVFFGDSNDYPYLAFNFSEDPGDYWKEIYSGKIKNFYSVQNTFSRLGRKLALRVLAKTRGIRLPHKKEQAIIMQPASELMPVSTSSFSHPENAQPNMGIVVSQ